LLDETAGGTVGLSVGEGRGFWTFVIGLFAGGCGALAGDASGTPPRAISSIRASIGGATRSSWAVGSMCGLEPAARTFDGPAMTGGAGGVDATTASAGEMRANVLLANQPAATSAGSTTKKIVHVLERRAIVVRMALQPGSVGAFAFPSPALDRDFDPGEVPTKR
jgi:hypothetical protein